MKTTNPQEKLTIMAGQDVRAVLSDDTRQQLAQAYFKLYFGLSWLNWLGPRQSWAWPGNVH